MDILPSFSTEHTANSFYLLSIYIVVFPIVLVLLSLKLIKGYNSSQCEKTRTKHLYALGIFSVAVILLQIAVTALFNSIFYEIEDSIKKHENELADYVSVTNILHKETGQCSLELESFSLDRASCILRDTKQTSNKQPSIFIEDIQNLKEKIQNLKNDKRVFEFFYPILIICVTISGVFCSGIFINLVTASKGVSSAEVKNLQTEIKKLRDQLSNVQKQTDLSLSIKAIVLLALLTSSLTSFVLITLNLMFG